MPSSLNHKELSSKLVFSIWIHCKNCWNNLSLKTNFLNIRSCLLLPTLLTACGYWEWAYFFNVGSYKPNNNFPYSPYHLIRKCCTQKYIYLYLGGKYIFFCQFVSFFRHFSFNLYIMNTCLVGGAFWINYFLIMFIFIPH